MSSVQDYVICPQCGYQCANHEFGCRMNEESFTCRSCGYHEHWDATTDEDGSFSGFKREATRGAGALFYMGNYKVTFCVHFLRTSKEVVDAEKWLREALDKGQVDLDVSYLTRWNLEAEQVELIIGTISESRGTGLGESKCESDADDFFDDEF
jgi:transposase-like protein